MDFSKWWSERSYQNEVDSVPVNFYEVYSKSRFFEYSVPESEDPNNNRLWLIFEIYNNRWHLAGVVHDGVSTENDWSQTELTEEEEKIKALKLLIEAGSPTLDNVVFEINNDRFSESRINTSNWLEKTNKNLGYTLRHPKGFFIDGPEVLKSSCDPESITNKKENCPVFIEGKNSTISTYRGRKFCHLKSSPKKGDGYDFKEEYYTIGIGGKCLTLHLEYKEAYCVDSRYCSLIKSYLYKDIINNVVDSFQKY